MKKNLSLAAFLSFVLMAPALAEPVAVEAVMSPKESMKMTFKDGSKHFVVMVRREGEAKGNGAFAGTSVTEYGWHDIYPPAGGDPHGYLELAAANGDLAYLKWQVRAVFMKGADKPKLFDNGVWELVSGTGQFAGRRGLGSLVIKAVSKTDRLFVIEGEIGEAP